MTDRLLALILYSLAALSAISFLAAIYSVI